MSGDLHSRLGELLAFLGFPRAAALAFHDALAARPGSPVRELRLARALLAARRWPEAASCLEACVKRQPWNVELHGERTLALVRAGRPTAALVCLRDFIAASPPAAEPWILLGVLERRAGRRHQAIRAFREAVRLPLDVRARRFVLGESLLGETGWAEAVAAHARVAPPVPATRSDAPGVCGRAARGLARLFTGAFQRLQRSGRRTLGVVHLKVGSLASPRCPHVGVRFLRSAQRLRHDSVQ